MYCDLFVQSVLNKCSNVLCTGLLEGTVGSQMCLQLPLSQYTNTELSCDVSGRPSYRPSHSGNVVYVYTHIDRHTVVMSCMCCLLACCSPSSSTMTFVLLGVLLMWT